MTEEPRRMAMAGLMAGHLRPLALYLRSFGDSALKVAADMIDDGHIVIEVPKEQRTRRKHDRIGVFVAKQLEEGKVLKAAVADATKLFGVERSTVMNTWSSYNKFRHDMEAKAASLVARHVTPEEHAHIMEAMSNGDREPLSAAVRRIAEMGRPTSSPDAGNGPAARI